MIFHYLTTPYRHLLKNKLHLLTILWEWACFNLTNTTLALSLKRFKEIGIRKVSGSSRSQIAVQFYGDTANSNPVDALKSV